VHDNRVVVGGYARDKVGGKVGGKTKNADQTIVVRPSTASIPISRISIIAVQSIYLDSLHKTPRRTKTMGHLQHRVADLCSDPRSGSASARPHDPPMGPHRSASIFAVHKIRSCVTGGGCGFPAALVRTDPQGWACVRLRRPRRSFVNSGETSGRPGVNSGLSRGRGTILGGLRWA
jgi:hypothetical protein